MSQSDAMLLIDFIRTAIRFLFPSGCGNSCFLIMLQQKDVEQRHENDINAGEFSDYQLHIKECRCEDEHDEDFEYPQRSDLPELPV